MEQYDKYKPSGVEWIGDIPGDWELKRLKFTSIINPSKNELARFPKSLEVSFYPMEAIGFGTLNHGEEKTLESVGNGFTYFRDGDILVAKITPSFENGKGALATGLKNGIGFGTTEIHVIRPLKNLNKHFLYYITYSHNFRHVGAGMMEGTAGQKRVPSDFLINHEIVIPSPEEQTAIANYLDDKTAQIDSLIGKKQKLIELIKEERTAIVNHAVTKGINPQAKLKPSGIEWLGDVPEHWEVKKLRFLCKITTGAKNTEDRTEDGEFPFFVRSQTIERINSYSFDGEGILTAGDGVGVAKVFHYMNGKFDFHQRVYLFYDFSNKISAQFLFYFIQMNLVHEVLRYNAKSTVDSLRLPMLKEFPISFSHSKEEQNQIVQHIETETKRIDETISKIEKEIELLQEYRTALISEVVTGKVKVI
jgi:restriction endonuclease S subunit